MNHNNEKSKNTLGKKGRKNETFFYSFLIFMIRLQSVEFFIPSDFGFSDFDEIHCVKFTMRDYI